MDPMKQVSKWVAVVLLVIMGAGVAVGFITWAVDIVSRAIGA